MLSLDIPNGLAEFRKIKSYLIHFCFAAETSGRAWNESTRAHSLLLYTLAGHSGRREQGPDSCSLSALVMQSEAGMRVTEGTKERQKYSIRVSRQSSQS